MDFDAAFNALASKLEAAGTGARRVNFRLRDWGREPPALLGLPDSRWSTAPTAAALPVPEEQLPVLLPEDVADAFASGDVHSPIKSDPGMAQDHLP